MPHRKPAGDNQHDARLASEIGRLYFSGVISKDEYEAGVKYAGIALRYLETIDAPEPYGGELSSIDHEECLRRKLSFASAQTILKAVGKRCCIAVDRVTIYDEPLRDDVDRQALRTGLRALCGQ